MGNGPLPNSSDIEPTLLSWRDIPAALGLLSRLPVPVDGARAIARSAKAPWAYPIAGLVLASIAAGVGQLAIWIGLSPGIVAGLAIGVLVVITGAMHEDGLADSADGLWGGWNKERRLDIMKDSRIGTYGVLSLVLAIGLRWQALAALIGGGLLWPALIIASMFSRAGIVALMAGMPNARGEGLSKSVGRPSPHTALMALALGCAGSLVMGTEFGILVIGVGTIACIACGWIAHIKIGGQTGDILGATQQVSEISILLAIAAFQPLYSVSTLT